MSPVDATEADPGTVAVTRWTPTLGRDPRIGEIVSKVLSVIIALVAAVAGYAALWQGSGTLLWVRGSFDAPAR